MEKLDAITCDPIEEENRRADARLAYSIAEVAQMVGLGRTTIFKEIKERRLAVVKVGARTLILHGDLSRWVSGFKG